MRKQLSIALMFCLGLIWAAAPSLACARMADPDCCPTGSGSPCEGEKSKDLATLAALCCVTAPATATTAAAEAPRGTYLQPQSPDPIAVLAWFATLNPREDSRPPAPPNPLATVSDGTSTYLRTLRLRL